ncbi:HotDog domain-containing protein [Aspergillus floccosus]
MAKRHLFFEPGLEIPAKDIEFFSSQHVVATYLNSPLFEPVPFVTRHADRNASTSNSFFSKVLNTDGTNPHLLAMVRKATPNLPTNATESDPDPHFIVFVHLGPDLCGFQDTAHGGVLAALLDEALGLCAESNELVSNSQVRLYTASLEIAYRAPVFTPSVAVIKTWIRRREGRKCFLEAKLLSEDGKVQVEAKTLYVSARVDGGL